MRCLLGNPFFACCKDEKMRAIPIFLNANRRSFQNTQEGRVQKPTESAIRSVALVRGDEKHNPDPNRFSSADCNGVTPGAGLPRPLLAPSSSHSDKSHVSTYPAKAVEPLPFQLALGTGARLELSTVQRSSFSPSVHPIRPSFRSACGLQGGSSLRAVILA